MNLLGFLHERIALELVLGTPRCSGSRIISAAIWRPTVFVDIGEAHGIFAVQTAGAVVYSQFKNWLAFFWDTSRVDQGHDRDRSGDSLAAVGFPFS